MERIQIHHTSAETGAHDPSEKEVCFLGENLLELQNWKRELNHTLLVQI